MLGVTLSNNFTWDNHVDEILDKCSKRINRLYKVYGQLNTKQRKNLAEGSIVSILKYALEVTSSASEKCIKRIEGMQSKAARFALGKSRKDWSRTAGYSELNWLTIPQSAVEMSLKLFFRVLWSRKPTKIYKSILDRESDEVRKISEEELG